VVPSFSRPGICPQGRAVLGLGFWDLEPNGLARPFFSSRDGLYWEILRKEFTMEGKDPGAQTADTTTIAELRAAFDEVRAELQSTRQRLLHAERMATLGTLMAGIAHEIRNPLNFVNNFAKLSRELALELQGTLERAAGVDPEAQAVLSTLVDNLGHIEQHGARAERIIRTMLIHARGGTQERRPTDINLLLAECTQLAYHGLRAQDARFNVTLHSDYDKRIGLRMLAQESLSRAYLNILGNALESLQQMQKGPHARAPMLWVASKLREGGLETRIRDNGMGVAKAQLGRVFEPFFTTKPPGRGTGLGLSICHDVFVREQGGTVHMESIEGEYAEVICFIPAEQAKPV